MIDDRAYQRGHLSERRPTTTPRAGTATCGTSARTPPELDAHGRVTSTEGTYHAGVDGARPEIFMPARPRVGEHHRQEYLEGHAEDEFRVIILKAAMTVPV